MSPSGAGASLALDRDIQDDPLIGETLGVYRLLRRLGQGGMGTVYEASAPGDRRVAVKLISAGSRGANVVRRFLREARATRSIESRHVVGVLDASDDGNSGPFLVMELLDGLDLQTLIRRVGALEPRAAARVFIQAARGLSAAHEKSIVHRDIKPANLFLHEEAEGTIVTKICDFGVAKDVGEDLTLSLDLTRTGGMLGSPLYMSPEQASNAKGVDARTDLWSLCLSLYEALSGQRPWGQCSTVGQLILAICTQNITPLRELAPWVSPELAAVVHKGLERDVARRWSSSAELAAALEPLALPGEISRRDLCAFLPALRPPVSAPRGPVAPPALASGDPLTLSASGAPLALSASGAPLTLSSLPAEVSPPSRSSGAPATTPVAPGEQGESRGNRRVTLLSIVGVLAVSGAVGGLWARRQETAQGLAVSSASGGVAAPRGAEVRRVSVRVSPPDARVLVRGEERSPTATGDFLLEGEVGESFDVRVEARGVSRQARVIILRDGVAEPPTIALSLPSSAGSAAASAAPASTASTASTSAPAAAWRVAGKTATTASARGEPTAVPPPPAGGQPKFHADL
jgi:serine/threonine-protein kinase